MALRQAGDRAADLDSSRALAPLISVLAGPNVGIRFWAVFAVGNIRDRRTNMHFGPSVISALASMLSDHAVVARGWWSVSRKALAALGQLDPPELRYQRQLGEEIRRVEDDPQSSPEDRRCAQTYGAQ